MNEYILETTAITKVFTGLKALNSVNINLKKSEILGLIGENGAGKSTLLKILTGLYPHGTYEGVIKIDGEEMQFLSPHDAHIKGIGYVPQEINVLELLSLAENIYMDDLRSRPGSIFVNFKKINQKASELMRSLGLNLNAGTKVVRLSTAEKQLLMIARALSKDIPILILDEPTTALTVNETKRLFETLKNLKAQGTSIIFVTHKLDEIWAMTDRVTVLRDGKFINTYEKENYDKSVIVRDMVGRSIDVMYPEREPKIGEEVLRIEGLTVPHPSLLGRNMISDVSFNLHKGEILGLAGLIGAGRTETARAIFGNLKLSAGKIFINGEEVKIRDENDAIEKGISLVTEDRKKDGLLMLNNIAKNVTISNLKAISKNSFLNNGKERDRALKYKQLMKIKASDVTDNVVSLSGGNQQKVLVARALNAEPLIILLDEPTKGIDVGSKSEIYQIMNELVAQGISIIMISSEMPELLAMCDRFIVMSNGKVVGELNKAEVSENKIMMMCIQ